MGPEHTRQTRGRVRLRQETSEILKQLNGGGRLIRSSKHFLTTILKLECLAIVTLQQSYPITQYSHAWLDTMVALPNHTVISYVICTNSTNDTNQTNDTGSAPIACLSFLIPVTIISNPLAGIHNHLRYCMTLFNIRYKPKTYISVIHSTDNLRNNGTRST